jgi:membrane-associated phospholipid phosphatase
MVSVRLTVAAVLAAVVAMLVYALMWLGYQQDWSWLDAADTSSLAGLHRVGVKHPSWVQFWEVVCTVLGPVALHVLGVATAVVAFMKRKLRSAVFLVISVEFSELVAWVAKSMADRQRPVTMFVRVASSSFPSGHALTIMVVVLALLTVLLPAMSRRLGVVAVVAGVLIVLAVGFGRVALNVHHPSDVLAGWALGYLYLACCAWAIHPWRPATRSGVGAKRTMRRTAPRRVRQLPLPGARAQPQPEPDEAGESDGQQHQHAHVE